MVALYLLPHINIALRPRLLTELRPGARIVSHAFNMGDWAAEGEEVHDGRRIFLWIVPAVAGGRWALADDDGASYELEIEQRYQQVTGTLTGAGRIVELRDAVLRGTSLAFRTDGPRLWRGTIEDAAITGEGWRGRRLS